MTGAGCCDGWGALDGALRPPEPPSDGVPLEPELDADGDPEGSTVEPPAAATAPPVVGPAAGEPGVVPVGGVVPEEAAGRVVWPGRAWLK
jgi:hypothetical protein